MQNTHSVMQEKPMERATRQMHEANGAYLQAMQMVDTLYRARRNEPLAAVRAGIDAAIRLAIAERDRASAERTHATGTLISMVSAVVESQSQNGRGY